MKQQIHLTESELRRLILEAINEEMEEGALADTLGQTIGGIFGRTKDKGQEMAQKVKDRATAAYKDLKTTYDTNKKANQEISASKKAAKTADRNNRQVLKWLEQDREYVNQMVNRYSDYNQGIATTAKTLLGSLQKAKDESGNRLKAANADYSQAQDAKRELRTKNTNRYRYGNAQPVSTNEAIDAIVDKIINEMINK